MRKDGFISFISLFICQKHVKIIDEIQEKLYVFAVAPFMGAWIEI